jgi:phage baseplate assembly protein gpV
VTRPATAAVAVTVDGQPCRDPQRIRSVRVASRVSQPTQCELVIGAARGDRGWPAQWAFGASVRVQVAGSAEDLFDGEVTCVELVHGPDGDLEIRVRAYDLLQRLRQRQHLRVLDDLTAAGLAALLTSDLGLDLTTPPVPGRSDRVVQCGQSDLDLLQDTCAAAGLHPVLRGRRLRLVTPAGWGEPVHLRLGASLWDLRVEANLDRVARRVTAWGWHTQSAEVLRQPADTPRTRPQILLDPSPEQVGGDGERHLVGRADCGAAPLAGLAQAALDASAGRAVTLSGVADGDVRLWAGSRVVVEGVAEEVRGEYVLTSAVHTIDAAGYLTSISTAPPPEPDHRSPDRTSGPSTSLTLAEVTAVDDPERLGRVRVRLPAYGGLDAGWLPVLCQGAGPDRGLVVLPDVADTVLVALPHRSHLAGIVLGSLYGTTRPPDPGVAGGAVRRWSMRTAGGQAVIVDDADNAVRVQNGVGSVIELGPDLLRLSAATDLVLEAPGHRLTVRARSVDFEQAL